MRFRGWFNYNKNRHIHEIFVKNSFLQNKKPVCFNAGKFCGEREREKRETRKQTKKKTTKEKVWCRMEISTGMNNRVATFSANVFVLIYTAASTVAGLHQNKIKKKLTLN